MIQESIEALKKQTDSDCIIYIGSIARSGYDEITKECANKRSRQAYLFLATYGGDPDAGFRIARSLRHYYERLTIVVPSFCKSAGTLLAIGADELVIGDKGELGPLDIQLKKPDELFEMSSGLDISQAFSFLREQSLEVFKGALYDLKFKQELTTKMASDIATKIATGLVSPIYAQIDPYKIGETQRAIAIAHAYGKRLNDKVKNLKTGALERLVTGYPSHEFVIDRKEASTLFEQVRHPTATEQLVIDALYNVCQDPKSKPIVFMAIDNDESEDHDEVTGNPSAEADAAPTGNTGAPDESNSVGASKGAN